MTSEEDLLDNIDLGPPRQIVALREEFSQEDLDRLQVPVAVPDALAGGPKRLQEVRHVHHEIARLLVEGRKQVEICALTGYSQSYIAGLQRQPVFQNLVASYEQDREIRSGDVFDRMARLHTATLEELQKRLDEDPEAWSKRELMDLNESLSKPLTKGSAVGVRISGGAVNIGISFVEPPEDKGNLIDGSATEVRSED